MDEKKKVLAICSGGLDSTVMAFYLKRIKNYEVKIINFNYGSKHNSIERKHLFEIFDKEDIITMDIDLSMFKSSLLISNDNSIPEGHYNDESMKSTVVPFRNGIMLSYAVGMAESLGYDAVALGSHLTDSSIYPDCRNDFIEAFKESAKLGTYKNIELIAPFNEMNMGKDDIVKLGAEMGIESEMSKTWSCYKGNLNEIHCGVCGTCQERIWAFKKSKVKDQTKYFLKMKEV